MFIAFFTAGLFIIAVVCGKTALSLLTTMPLIGWLADFYFHFLPDIGSGTVANLVYGLISLQVLILALAPIFYGPQALRIAKALLRRYQHAEQPG